MHTEGASGVFIAILVAIVGAIVLSAAGLLVLREQTPLALVTPAATEAVVSEIETAEASTPAAATAPPTPVATTTPSDTSVATPSPPALPPTPTAAPEIEYVVVAGDGVEVLAARFGVPAEAIIERNGLQPPYTLSIGQVLVIPTDE